MVPISENALQCPSASLSSPGPGPHLHLRRGISVFPPSPSMWSSVLSNLTDAPTDLQRLPWHLHPHPRDGGARGHFLLSHDLTPQHHSEVDRCQPSRNPLPWGSARLSSYLPDCSFSAGAQQHHPTGLCRLAQPKDVDEARCLSREISSCPAALKPVHVLVTLELLSPARPL